MDLKELAKKFNDNYKTGLYTNDERIKFAINFLQYAIDKGVIVEAEIYHNKISVLHAAIEKLGGAEIQTIDGADLETHLLCGRCGRKAKNGKIIGDHCGEITNSERMIFCSGSIVQSTLSSAGKEVKTAESLYEKAFYNPQYDAENGNRNMKQRVVGIMEEYANQFKSSPAGTEVPEISDEEIENNGNRHEIESGDNDGFGFDAEDLNSSFVSGAKWYRDLLKDRS